MGIPACVSAASLPMRWLRGALLAVLLAGAGPWGPAAFAAPCPCSLWPDTTAPDTASVNDPAAVELGVRFRADSAGLVTAIRFYKGAANTGVHTGSLWSADGTRLATTTFAAETASGWQQAALDPPVRISAGTTYVASYHAPAGGYAASNRYFEAQGVDNAPLHAPRSGVDGGNGVYAYGAQGSFPSSSYQHTNYWVDVVFEPSTTPDPPPPDAPILVVTSTADRFTQYHGEILRAEGLNAFAMADIGLVTPALLAGRDLVLLGRMALTDAQVAMFSDWVQAGGNLVAMRPDKKLAGLLGLADAGGTLADGYLLPAPWGPGLGITQRTMQFHDAADLYTPAGATTIATLYANAATATPHPAVTLRAVGSGHAAAFTYDLARSVVYTRQGNPAYAGQERDGQPPLRPDDLMIGHLDLDKVAIPQADEQQRLLANLVTQINLAKKPLPRFWYLPRGLKAAIVHTLDDHGTATGTRATFDKLLQRSAPGCSVEDWQCLRATAWVYTGIPLPDADAAAYQAAGFELGVHVQNGTTNFTSFAEVEATYAQQLANFRQAYPSVLPQATHRYHAILWSDWLSQARAARQHGIRYSMDYYFWPPQWTESRSGLLTGSGFPMRFADVDGSIADIYQASTDLVNETINAGGTQAYPGAMHALLDRALGAEGYYGLFGTHDDYRDTEFLDAVINVATARGVPVIGARQALAWVDGRNASSFAALSWDGRVLGFSIEAGTGARGLQAMLPVDARSRALSALSRNGQPVAITPQTIKGMRYAFFDAQPGSYTATYDGAIAPPEPPAGGVTLWPGSTTPAVADFPDANAYELGLRFRADRPGRIVALRFYKGTGNTGPHTGSLWGADGTRLATAPFVNETATGWQQALLATPVRIAADTPYIASYHAPAGHYAVTLDQFAGAGVDSPPLHAPPATAAEPNGVYAAGASAFPTASSRSANYWVDVVFVEAAASVHSLWDASALPAILAVNDPNPVELGLRFRADVPGRITGIRFYKGEGNTGPHTATLWSEAGTALASATFADETASGWQEVRFATPVEIAASTTYVASYHAPAGRYAATAGYFGAGFSNAPLNALPAGTGPGNGVYRYGASSFPDQSFNATNYWVDVLFEPSDSAAALGR
jgi:hypothetical protein